MPDAPVTPAAPTSQSAPPIGVSPATQPTPNRGFEMAGLQGLGVALKQLETLVPKLGAGSDAGRDVLKCITMLAKHIQPGSVTPAGERNELQSQMMRQQQAAQQMARMRQQMMAGQQKPPMQPGAPPPPTTAAA